MASEPRWMYACETSTRRSRMSTTSQPHVTQPPSSLARDRGGPAQPLLMVHNLRKYFPVHGGILNRTVGHIQAVDDVSFSVMKGETLGIVGESGCGKSTLARLILHLVQPDAGELIFDGEAVQARDGMSVRELRRNVQMVFQDSYSSLNPRMPVEDSIAYGPRARRQTGCRQSPGARFPVGGWAR